VEPAVAAQYDALLRGGHVDAWPRGRDTFTAFFDGLELVDPGVVALSDWRAEQTDRPTPAEVSMYGAVGRKP
jgi:hypothetical protein